MYQLPISHQVQRTSLRGAKRRGNPDAFEHKGLYDWLDCRASCRAPLAAKGFFAMTAFYNWILVTSAPLKSFGPRKTRKSRKSRKESICHFGLTPPPYGGFVDSLMFVNLFASFRAFRGRQGFPQ
jgi:hypothetical protein